MTYTVFKGPKKLGCVEAKDLKEAEKVADKKFKEWSEIYEGKRNDNW